MSKPYCRQRVHISKPVGAAGNACDVPNALKEDHDASHFQSWPEEIDMFSLSDAGFALTFNLISSSAKWERPNMNAFQQKDFT